jgi:hypothetical protein
MNSKEQRILQSLLKLYVDMYPSKELFNKVYFKYSPQDVEKTIISLQEEKTPSPNTKRKKTLKEAISSIHSEDQVHSYYLRNLQYDRNDSKSKESCLKKITLEELKHLYCILYTSPLKSSLRKSDVLDLIERYFASIERARSLKP